MAVPKERLYFNKVGEGNKLLVMLHAFPVNHNLFSEVWNLILPEDWTALFPDFPGFGNTPTDKGREVLTMTEMSSMVNNIIEGHGYDQFVLGGVSMGGYVAMAYEREYPGNADAYILSNTRDTADADGGKGREEVIARIENGEREEWLRQDFIPRALGETTISSRQRVIERCWDMFSSASDLAIIQTMRGMGERPSSEDIFEQLHVPILVIVGDEDKITGPEVGEDMVARYRKAEMRIIENAGHYAAIEKPKTYAVVVKEFLSNL